VRYETRHVRQAAAVLIAALPFFIVNGARAADAAAAKQKAVPCAACHGPEGNSTNPAIPSLAAQPKQFIVTQLFMFREGNRKDPQMSPIAAPLSNADMNELAAYFSAQKHAPPAKPLAADKAAAGRAVTEKYNCTQCHGPQLLGQQHIPRLAGQQAQYLKTQLRGFKASTRFDMDGQMTSAAQPLTAQDIELLGDYLSGLDVPAK
jgi:cytochrome c553